jgi:prepilin-type N-terminal cleavage/methylation domain-containing protein
MKFLNNSRGFTLVEMIVSTALIGGIALYLMQQQQTSTNMQSKFNYNQDLNLVTQIIQTELAKKKNCTLTLQGKAIGDDLDEGIKVVDPRDPSKFITLFKAFSSDSPMENQLASSKVKIASIKLEKLDPEDSDSPDVIRIKFKAGHHDQQGRFVASKMQGSGDLTKTILVQGIKKNNRYIDCYTEPGFEEQACRSIGATWDEQDEECKLTNLPQCVYTEGACGTLYQETGRSQILTEFNGQRVCAEFYEPKLACLTSYDHVEMCTCNYPGCTCRPPAKNCFDRFKKGCWDAGNKTTTLKECCRPLHRSETGGSSGTEPIESRPRGRPGRLLEPEPDPSDERGSQGRMR